MVSTRTKIISVTLVFLGIGYWYFFLRTNTTSTSMATVKVQTGSIRSTVKTTGKISPVQTSTLTFSRGGTISKIYKKIGDAVNVGEVIAEIDAKTAYLDIESAKISLSNARNNYTSIIEGASLTDTIRAENTLSESKARLTILEKTLENLKIEEKNTLAEKERALKTLEQKVILAQGELEYAEKNINTDSTTTNLERDTANAFLLLEDVERIMPDIIKSTKDILHIEDKSSPFYGDFSAKETGFKTKAESSYTSLIKDFSTYKSRLLDLRGQNPRGFSGTLELMTYAKSFLDSYATLVGSTMIYAIDSSTESSYFPTELHDSYKATLRGYASTLNTKLSSINSTLSTLRSYGSESLQSLADKNTIAQKKTALESAQSDLKNAEENMEQTKKSYYSKILSATDDIVTQNATIRLNEASYTDTVNGAKKSERVSAENAVRSAELSLEKAKLALEDYQIIAPFDGVINDIPWIKGDTVDTTKGVLIENKDAYEIILSLDQIDIVKVREGMPAKIVLDAFPKETYTGSVSRISAVPTETSGVVSYEATVLLRIPRKDIYSKMSATVEIILAEKNNILVVPTGALTSKEGKSYLQVSSRSGSPIKTEVSIGISDNGKTEILSGVTLGDRVNISSTTSSGSSSSTTSARRNSTFGGPPPGL